MKDLEQISVSEIYFVNFLTFVMMKLVFLLPIFSIEMKVFLQKKGTHTARHHLTEHPLHMQERPRQPIHSVAAVRWSHDHSCALRVSATHFQRMSGARSIEYSKAAMLLVLCGARSRTYQLVSRLVRVVRSSGAAHLCIV